MFQGCSKEVSGIFQESFRVVQGSFKGVSRKFQGCFMKGSRLFQGCSKKILSKRFQDFFRVPHGCSVWNFYYRMVFITATRAEGGFV